MSNAASTATKQRSKLAPPEIPPIIGRTVSGGFRTEEGTIHVSRPFRSKKSRKLRAMVSFTPRKSAFDTTNEMSGMNEFRGFFTLFWISMFLFTVRTYIRSLEENGYFLPLAFARKISQDAIILTLSDATLVITTGLCVPYALAIRNGWIRYYWLGVVIQHTFQAAVLAIAVLWTFNRQWPWVQSGFLTLHSLVLIMKMHSYMTVNGYLSHIKQQALSTEKRLHALVDRKVGGWNNAIIVAESRRADMDGADGHSTVSSDNEFGSHLPVPSISVEGTGANTPATPLTEAAPSPPDDGSTKAYVSANNAMQLRQRLVRAADELTPVSKPMSVPNVVDPVSTPPLPTGTTHLGSNIDINEPHAPGVHPLVDHPDEAISALATELSELESELVSSGPEYVKWPNNITWKDFTVYMLIPSLCYELEYPRTDRIRPLYVFEKTVATFGSFALLYTITESFILPLTPTSDQSFFRSLLDLALPFMVAYLLLFYLIFECVCNGFAELSYFADRQFYEDWWNSTSWDEFSRKWNKPVHAFLLRHVYASTISTYHLSRSSAMFVTFLLSACVHELVMAIVTQKIRLYLFALQLIQIPLILVGRLPVIKRNKLAGNVVFWLGLYAGFPLLCVAYCAY